MEINDIKTKIYESIRNGDVSNNAISPLILKTGKIVPKECELWDYKQSFSGDDTSYLKTLKSIASFYNTYGGYILFGVHELEKDTVFELIGLDKQDCLDQQKLRGKFDKHFGRRIDVTYAEFLVDSKRVGLLHIPKRPLGEHSAAVIKDGAVGNDKILEKPFTYYRAQDESKQAKSQADFEFICGGRDFYEKSGGIAGNRKKVIEHNLPDKNFICPRFIGRFSLIQELWSWLGDEFQYYKVLAGEGGKGKTSIAYEFCQLVAKSGIPTIEQIIWVTAKKQQFKALHNSYISTPETHYSDLHSLLRIVCLMTGSLESELADCGEIQLKRIAKANLETFPSLIVVDDVDSNSPDEQRRIMESVRMVANPKSRVLLTTRVNNIYSSDSCIQVPGLAGEEYENLVKSSCDFLDLQNLNQENIEKLRVASEGSPLFTDSILRLFKRGVSLQKAIDEWKGKSGCDAREAALRKEVEELGTEARQILLTLSYVGACSVTEIQQLTELSQVSIADAIEQLGNLFLLQGQQFIKNEPRIEAHSSVASLVLSIQDELIPNGKAFIQCVHDIAEGLRAIDESKGNLPEVGAAIRQSSALIYNERYEDARKTVMSFLEDKKYKENADLLFMLARVDYKDPDSSFETVRNAFSQAYIKGQRKESFFEMWYVVESQASETHAVLDVCKAAVENGLNGDSWLDRYSICCEKQSREVINFNRKIELLVEAYEYASKLIKVTYGGRWRRQKERCTRIADELWFSSLREEEYEIAYRSVKNAINNGDIRGDNFMRVAEILETLKAKITNQSYLSVNNPGALLGDIERFASKLVSQLRKETNPRISLIDRLVSAIDIEAEAYSE